MSVQHSWGRVLLHAEAVRLGDQLGQESYREFLGKIESGRAGRSTESGTPLVRALEWLRAEAAQQGLNASEYAMGELRPHDLRRTAGSLAVGRGASLPIIACMLGHGDTRVTEAHYAHLTDEPVRAVVDENARQIMGKVLKR